MESTNLVRLGIIFVLLVTTINLGKAEIQGQVGINFVYATPVNYSSQNVNSSQYLDGLNASQFWQTSNDQTGLTGDKNGSFDLTTSGKGAFGNTTDGDNILRTDNGNVSFTGKLGSELKWLYQIGSFRAGGNNSITTLYSSALGSTIKILLQYSVGMGYGHTLDGLYGNAVFGYINFVNGSFDTVAGGLNNVQNVNYTSVFGSSNNVNSSFCLVAGSGNVVYPKAPYSFVVGTSNKVASTNSIAGGFDNLISTSDYGIGLGLSNRQSDSNYSSIIGSGNNISNTQYGVAIGSGNLIFTGREALDLGAGIALGLSNEVTGEAGMAIGLSNIISGIGAIGIGINTYITGVTAYALGQEVNATQDEAIIIGHRFQNDKASTIALGVDSSMFEVNSTDVTSFGNFQANRNLVVLGNFSAKRAFYYGYDNSTQAFLNTANAQVVNISNNNDFKAWQIAVVNKQNITFQTTGEYIVSLSPEFFQNSGGEAKVTFWIQVTNAAGTVFSDVPWSNSRYTIPNNAYNAPTIEYPVEITDTRMKVRLMWWSDSTSTVIYSSGALTSPTRPSIPGILINIRKSSAI